MVKLIILIALLAAGYFMPIGEYTTQSGVCFEQNPPTKHLSWLRGDRLTTIKDGDNYIPAPTEGCRRQIHYVLHVL